MSSEKTITDVVREGLLSGDDYNTWLARAEELLRECCQLRGGARANLADELSASVVGDLPLFSDIGWLADVLGFAIGDVDWLEIAAIFVPLHAGVGSPLRAYIMCLRHPFETASWEIAPGTYACDECQRDIRDRHLQDEGVASAFHNPRGFIREPDGSIVALK